MPIAPTQPRMTAFMSPPCSYVYSFRFLVAHCSFSLCRVLDPPSRTALLHGTCNAARVARWLEYRVARAGSGARRRTGGCRRAMPSASVEKAPTPHPASDCRSQRRPTGIAGEDDRHAADVGQDLRPDRAAGRPTGNPQLLNRNAGRAQLVKRPAHLKSRTFQDGPAHITPRMGQIQADERRPADASAA